MKLSPLQLLEYFVAEFHFTLNSRFDAKKPLALKLEELEVVPKWEKRSDNLRQWTVVLNLKYQPAAETNTPYIIALTLVGVFKVADTYDDAKAELLVRINGASVLYGIARELIREQTARGPDGPFIIPTASFVPDTPSPVKPAPAAQTPSAQAAGVATEKVAVPETAKRPTIATKRVTGVKREKTES